MKYSKFFVPVLAAAVLTVLPILSASVGGDGYGMIILNDSTHDDHGIHHVSDSTEVHHRSSDDGPFHDINDDHGMHHMSDSTEVHHRSGDDGSHHDLNDDHGKNHEQKESEHHHRRRGRDK